MLWENGIKTGLGLVLIAEAAGKPVAAAVILAWNGTMIGKFIASDEEGWSLRPNNLLVWHAVQAASELGWRWFDFGRTDAANSGLRAYKQSWGAVKEPLVYGTLGANPEPASQGNGMASRLLACAIRYGPLLVCRALARRYTGTPPEPPRRLRRRAVRQPAARRQPRRRDEIDGAYARRFGGRHHGPLSSPQPAPSSWAARPAGRSP